MSLGVAEAQACEHGFAVALSRRELYGTSGVRELIEGRNAICA